MTLSIYNINLTAARRLFSTSIPVTIITCPTCWRSRTWCIPYTGALKTTYTPMISIIVIADEISLKSIRQTLAWTLNI